VADAIAAVGSDLSANALLVETARSALQHTNRSNESSSVLPLELRALSRLRPPGRHCFTLRVLMGSISKSVLRSWNCPSPMWRKRCPNCCSIFPKRLNPSWALEEGSICRVRRFWAILGNALREGQQEWQSWQRGICNLQAGVPPFGCESLSLRLPDAAASSEDRLDSPGVPESQ
jgi:hypothetical protein